MLRDKFKKCEKTPKTDYDCQIFKMNLCGAFPNFPCCVDVISIEKYFLLNTIFLRFIF